MTLMTTIYEGPEKATQLMTLPGGFSFSTGEHGFRDWRADSVEVGYDQAQEIFNWPGVPHVETVDESGAVIWQGRLEDIAIRGGSVSLGAFGYWRALLDVPYTALWSKTGSGGWRAITTQTFPNVVPEKYNMDNNNRVYISLKKNQVYASGNSESGAMVYELPHNGERDLVSITYDYDITLPSGWDFRLFSATQNYASADVDQSHNGNGASQTGTETINLTADRQVVMVRIRNNSGSAYTNTAEDDDWFIRLTNIRILTQATQVLASDIAAAIATYVNGVNSAQLSASSGLIAPTTTDLQDELYEDQYPADILDRLALLHGYETGVYEDRRLHFRERGSAGKAWRVNVRSTLEAQRSLDNIANSVYGVYRDAGGRTLRTAVAADAASQARFGVTRRDYVNVQTTSQTEAETHRNAMLADRADDFPRVSLEVDYLEDDSGGLWPLYQVRAGDTVTFRDLLPYALSSDDALSTFIVGETQYNSDDADRVQIMSREPFPSLVTLVARRDAGIR